MTAYRIAVVIILTTQFLAAGAEPDTDARKKIVAALVKEAERRPFLHKLESDLVADLAKKKDAKKADQLKYLKQEIKDIDAIKTPEGFAPKLALAKGGEWGSLPFEKARVGEVIDKESAIIETRTNPAFPAKNEPVSVIVRGVDTKNWADGAAIDSPPGIFTVDTEKRGGRTYLRLTPLALTKEESAAIMEAAKVPPPPKKK